MVTHIFIQEYIALIEEQWSVVTGSSLLARIEMVAELANLPTLQLTFDPTNHNLSVL